MSLLSPGDSFDEAGESPIVKTKCSSASKQCARRIRWFLPILFAFVVLSAFSGPAISKESVALWVTHPWLAMTTRFIGGAYCSIHSIHTWDESGALKRTENPPKDAVILAFDPSDAKDSGIPEPNEKVMLLYKRDLGGLNDLDMPFLDPATLPFIGLRILKNISRVDPENYSYYQRRLAEFSARLDSTVLVGRQMLGATRLLDLSWQVGRWIQAATSDLIRPPAGVKKSWGKGHDMQKLELAIREAEKQGWLILCDAWTPEHVIERVRTSSSCLILPAPSAKQDFFLYLYDLYLLVWNSVRSPGAEEGTVQY
jgi:hypothetical protein